MTDQPKPFDLEEWQRACERAFTDVASGHESVRGEYAEEAARILLGIARCLAGTACPRCQGEGARAYGSTATWRGGIGGQAITSDVCDVCWGTGRKDQTGPNLRKLLQEQHR